MNIIFAESDISREPAAVLAQGRWANADVKVISIDGVRWVVKDFSKRSPPVRHLMARWLIWRELRALQRLEGMEGIPTNAQLVGRWAIVYSFAPGTTMREAKDDGRELSESYFLALEQLVKDLHSAGVVHLDMRNGQNILIGERDEPILIDFQSAIFLNHVPKWLANFMRGIDLSGVYKYWQRLSPETIGDDRIAYMNHAMRFRRFWQIQGYPLKRLRRYLRHSRRRSQA